MLKEVEKLINIRLNDAEFNHESNAKEVKDLKPKFCRDEVVCLGQSIFR